MQVESDIKPFKGLLMGLFFMSVGMDMQFGVFARSWAPILASLCALVLGKLGIMMLLGKPSGVSNLSAIRAGLYVAPGGEFAFVVFSEAVEKGLLTAGQTAPIVFMVVLSMAITPYLAVRCHCTACLRLRIVCDAQTRAITAGTAGRPHRHSQSITPNAPCARMCGCWVCYDGLAYQ